MTQHLNARYADIKRNSARVSRKMTLHISVLLLNVDLKFVRKYRNPIFVGKNVYSN